MGGGGTAAADCHRGGGIAGLNAALTLQDAGVTSTVYEASPWLGGRMHSDTTSWLNGQVSERCGELIDSGHTTILNLAKRFKIPVADVRGTEGVDRHLLLLRSVLGVRPSNARTNS